MKTSLLKTKKTRIPGILPPMIAALIVLTAVYIFVITGNKDLYVFKYDKTASYRNIAVIVPGMNQSDKSPGYDLICGYYKDSGITPVFVNINWKSLLFANKSRDDLLGLMLLKIFPESDFYLFGFSAGAAETFKLSRFVKARQIILCSMSPVFKEDRPYIPFPFQQILNMTGANSTSLSTPENGKGIYFLYGEHDSFLFSAELIKNRKSYCSNAKTVIVQSAGHNISLDSYLAAVKKIIKEIKIESY